MGTEEWFQVLTGVTGSLGAYLIERLDRLPPSVIGEIVCLVRADDDAAALLRVEQGLSQRSIELLRKDRIVAYTADLADPKLGLTEERYTDLQSQVDVVIHVSRRQLTALMLKTTRLTFV
jgi:thioester reductase-like protein